MIQTFTKENDREKYFLASLDTVSSPLPLPAILLPQVRGGDFLDFSRRGGHLWRKSFSSQRVGGI